MNPPQPPETAPQGRSESPKHNNKSIWRFKKHSKLAADPQDSEQAPLLVNDVDQPPDDDEPSSQDQESLTWQQRTLRLAERALFWILENLIIVVLACLLAAGTVIVCVYGSMFNYRIASTQYL
jgi:hypothetical protein